MGQVFYFAPDRLEWEETDYNYSEWLRWSFTGDLDKYYESMRWPGWREEVRSLPGDQAWHSLPPLWAEAPEGRQCKAIPIAGMWGVQHDIAAQLAAQATP